MNDEYFDSQRVEAAKRMARGPLGEEISKFPLLFCGVLFFADEPRASRIPDINHGTLSLVKFEDRQIGITCSHVIEEYRNKRKSIPTLQCIFGLIEIDPLSRLIDENVSFDLATLDLNDIDLRKVTDNKIASNFFCPAQWPPMSVKEGDFVSFGGFPGLFRSQTNFAEYQFESFSHGNCRVASVREDYLVCQFEREYLISSSIGRVHYHLPEQGALNIGGLSGGPVFIWRKLHWEFAGIIYEYSQEHELLYIRPAKFIDAYGKILI